ncbi:MAG: hypothetical protein ACK5MR_15675 [Cumulibacter sp.]|uniref:hypothetical protein n=1 Tax=Cumulibacter soli TaxID=2546344 RepID=UPI0014196F54|nr:hypothetical protein [Cumulibacter soli]
MSIKKLISLLLLAFVIFYVLTFPEESSNIVHSTVDALGTAASNFATFVKSIFS